MYVFEPLSVRTPAPVLVRLPPPENTPAKVVLAPSPPTTRFPLITLDPATPASEPIVCVEVFKSSVVPDAVRLTSVVDGSEAGPD